MSIQKYEANPVITPHPHIRDRLNRPDSPPVMDDREVEDRPFIFSRFHDMSISRLLSSDIVSFYLGYRPLLAL